MKRRNKAKRGKGEIIWNRHPSCPTPLPLSFSVPQYSGAPVSCVRVSERWRAGAGAGALWLDSYMANGKTGKRRRGWKEMGRYWRIKMIQQKRDFVPQSLYYYVRQEEETTHPTPPTDFQEQTVTQLLFSRPKAHSPQFVQEGGSSHRPIWLYAHRREMERWRAIWQVWPSSMK